MKPGGQKTGDERRLVDAFCQFHTEVVSAKRQVLAQPAANPWDAVQQRLLDTFETQGTRVLQTLPEHENRLFEETRYVMIAMADEVFLSIEWDGKGPWADKPLESIVFRTRDAGERFFRRIDDALAGRTAASAQILTVYITALAIGFRGKYAALGTNDPETYRQRLAEYIARSDPDFTRSEELCPQAHEHTLDKVPEKRLPSFSRGILPFILVLVGWVVVGEVLWLFRTAELDDTLDRIEDTP